MVPRIMHDLERQYLTLDAQGIIYIALLEEEISLEVAEIAINEAINIGQVKHAKVDGDLMRDLITFIEAEKSGGNSEFFPNQGSGMKRPVC